ncbi:MAG TPA: hypothetical protein PKA61_02780 [Nitrospira sp.]|nr:hypothetical protein [Nitrospira sp.]
MTMVMAALLLLLVVAALYAFGVFGTPYLNAFRFIFYMTLVMLAMVVIMWMGGHQGYDPTPANP